jgi:hypothetical protein
MNRCIMSFTFGITYGSRAVRMDSQHLTDFLHVNRRFIDALELGRMPLVDLFPIMTIVPPRWAKWKRTINAIREEHEHLYGYMLKRVEDRLENGQSTPGFMEEAVKNANEWDLTTPQLLTSVEVHNSSSWILSDCFLAETLAA